jgi:Sec-independent protein translocase protein TatA
MIFFWLLRIKQGGKKIPEVVNISKKLIKEFKWMERAQKALEAEVAQKAQEAQVVKKA